MTTAPSFSIWKTSTRRFAWAQAPTLRRNDGHRCLVAPPGETVVYRGRPHRRPLKGPSRLPISVSVLLWIDYDHAEMSRTRYKNSECDLHFEGFRLWIHNRASQKSQDYWDGNWLYVTAICEASGSVVRVTGSILHAPEIDGFRRGLEKLNEHLEGKAELDCMEPYLGISVEAQSLGHLRMVVAITPDILNQTHKFVFETDQSWLPRVISDCNKILERYPIVGTAKS